MTTTSDAGGHTVTEPLQLRARDAPLTEDKRLILDTVRAVATDAIDLEVPTYERTSEAPTLTLGRTLPGLAAYR
jgi:hypothetical protein